MAKLRAKLPQSVRLNKPLIVTLLALVAIALLVALINAFITASPRIRTRTTDMEGSAKSFEALKQLPDDYSDRPGITKYLSTGGVSPDVQKALDILRGEQHLLEAKLANQSVSIAPQGGPQADQARTSGLFFSGSAPDLATQRDSDRNSNNPKSAAETKADGGGDSYQLQNGQMQKLKFLLSSDKPEDIYNPHKLNQPSSPFLVQAGTIIPGTMLTSINSSLPGNVVAQIRNDVYDTVSGQFVLIPKGSKLIGQYDSQVAYGQERVLLAFTRVIRPDGSSILLDKLGGTDSQGNAGVAGDVDNHWGKILGAAVISTVLSMGAGAVADNSSSGSNYYPNATQGALGGASANVSQTGQQLSGKAMNIQPTLTLPAGYQFDMIVNKDIILNPYPSGA